LSVTRYDPSASTALLRRARSQIHVLTFYAYLPVHVAHADTLELRRKVSGLCAVQYYFASVQHSGYLVAAECTTFDLTTF
jgi:hypothetical protein